MDRIIRWIFAAVGIALLLYASATLIDSLDRKADMESRLTALEQEAEELHRENARIVGEFSAWPTEAPAANEVPGPAQPPL